jgi:hypothetical protein
MRQIEIKYEKATSYRLCSIIDFFKLALISVTVSAWIFLEVSSALCFDFKGTVSQDFLLQVFFMNHLPAPEKNNSRVISNFLEQSWRYSQVKVQPPVSTTPAGNFATSMANVVDTGGKFATGVNNTSSKFAAGVNDSSGK